MIKKFIAVAAFVFAFAFAFTASAYDFGSTTLKKGSTGAAVMQLQQALNDKNMAGLSTDGKFGNGTFAAVKAFQASKGLFSDGLAGNATKMALNASVSTPTPSASLCPNGMTLASNCMTSPSGTPTNNSGAPLSINSVQAVSGYLNTAVGVGQVDKQIANLRVVTGAGGAGNLTGLNVSFANAGTGDYQFTKYAQSVAVWLNGTKVGTISAGEFSQYNSIYSAFIPVSGAILNANSTNNLVLSVTALPTIDSANYAADAWGVDVTSIRYSDGSGVFTYSPSAVFGAALTATNATSLNTYFQFASSASAQSIKLTVTRNIGDSNDSVVVGQTSTNTLGVTVAKIDLNAQGDTISLRRLPVTLATASGTASHAYSIVNTLRLYDANGTQLDSQPVVTGAGAQTITFQNLNVNVPVNTTQTFTVKADFNSVSSFTAGEGISVSASSTNVNNIQAYDSGSNVLNNTSSTTLTGSTTGNVVSMYVNGVNVTAWGTPPSTNVASAGGAQTHSTVTYTIPFAVTAFGSVAYVPSTAGLAASASATNKIQFCVDATTACSAAAGPTAVVVYAGSDNFTANTTNGNFQIPIGQTKNFNLIITYQPASAISTRASLVNVNWATTDIQGTSGWSTYTSGLSSNTFKTPYAAAQ